MTRLFVAFAVPGGVRDALDGAVAPLRERHDELRWARPASWHVTLAFLGELPVGARIRAVGALHRATRNAPSCPVTLSGRLGRFGHRVLWAAVDSPDAALDTLVTRIRRELASARLPVDDRPFRPHLTLARGHRGLSLPGARIVTAPGLPCTWPVSVVALMASSSGGRRNGYRTVATWPLAAGGADA